MDQFNNSSNLDAKTNTDLSETIDGQSVNDAEIADDVYTPVLS